MLPFIRRSSVPSQTTCVPSASLIETNWSGVAGTVVEGGPPGAGSRLKLDLGNATGKESSGNNITAVTGECVSWADLRAKMIPITLLFKQCLIPN